MASVYDIKITTTSSWVNYKPENLAIAIQRAIEQQLSLENTTVEVERKA